MQANSIKSYIKFRSDDNLTAQGNRHRTRGYPCDLSQYTCIYGPDTDVDTQTTWIPVYIRTAYSLLFFSYKARHKQFIIESIREECKT